MLEENSFLIWTGVLLFIIGVILFVITGAEKWELLFVGMFGYTFMQILDLREAVYGEKKDA